VVTRISIFASSLLVLLPISLVAQGTKLDSRFDRRTPEEVVTAWIFFQDKGAHELLKSAVPQNLVSPRSLARRLRVLPAAQAVDYTDLPLEDRYVADVEKMVLALRQRSKWMNAVSVRGTIAQLCTVADLPYVVRVEPVMSARRRTFQPVPTAESPSLSLGKTNGTTALDYGPSLAQVSLINVPAVHNTGNHAEGVMIGLFDNGVRLPTHHAFDSVSVIATRDFVDKKTSVIPISGFPYFGAHGVETFSVIGGYAPGKVIGPAFGATFIIARTENDSSETPFEEDNWAAAIEWADSIGVQVTSTSLGYGGPGGPYDLPYTSWTWQAMDGRTTVISRAAAIAVRKGIIVVNSAGNDGFNASHNTLGAPADADSVLTVGATDPNGNRAGFSSVGPTTSIPPHIKPDVVAQGTNIAAADPNSVSGYIQPGDGLQGTSFSCPLTAGAVALVVKACPSATPMEIVNALKTTASQALTPDNLKGWGVINTLAAIQYLLHTDTGHEVEPVTFSLSQNFPNPFNPKTAVSYQLPAASKTRIAVYDMLGREVEVLVNETKGPGQYSVDWNATGMASGFYICRMTAGDFVSSRKMLLLR
jgi:serine protease AprX